MKILGIDTSAPEGSVALVDSNGIISESILGGSKAYSHKLLEEVDNLLNRSKTKLKEPITSADKLVQVFIAFQTCAISNNLF